MAIQRYDYEYVKLKLLNLLLEQVDANDPDYPVWKDIWESSTGTVLIEQVASGVDEVGYYLERRVIENYLNTALLRSSIYNLASGLGYLPSRKQSSNGEATLVFTTPITETLFIDAGSELEGSNNQVITTFEDYIIVPGDQVIGTGDGGTTHFTATLAEMEAGTLKILVNGVEVGSDDGEGTIQGSAIIGTIDYETGALVLYFSTAPTLGASITSDYTQTYTINVYQGERQSYTFNISETTSYIELDANYPDISEFYFEVYILNTTTGDSYSYELATTGEPHARATDRWYWARYSFGDKLRLYFGKDGYGRNPYQDGNQIQVNLIITDGGSGNISSELGTAFSGGGPRLSSGALYDDAEYSVTINRMYNGANEESLESTRTNAINLYSTGLRAVTKLDYKYWILSYSSVSKSNVWAEEDVSPPNLEMRNTVKFTAVDEDCIDIDQSVASGYCYVTESVPASGVWDKVRDLSTNMIDAGVQIGDAIIIGGFYKRVATVSPLGDFWSVLIEDPFTYEFTLRQSYHISPNIPPASEFIRGELANYKTITVRTIYETPIIVPIELFIEVEVKNGYVLSEVLSTVKNTILDTFHPTYFNFQDTVAISYFWNVATDVEGVKTCSIEWKIDGSWVDDNYYNLSGDEVYRQIPTLRDVHMAQAGTMPSSSSSSLMSSSSSGAPGYIAENTSFLAFSNLSYPNIKGETFKPLVPSIISIIQLYVSNPTSSTGRIQIEIQGMDGVLGTTGIPNGTVIGTSSPYNVNTISTTGQWINVAFGIPVHVGVSTYSFIVKPLDSTVDIEVGFSVDNYIGNMIYTSPGTATPFYPNAASDLTFRISGGVQSSSSSSSLPSSSSSASSNQLSSASSSPSSNSSSSSTSSSKSSASSSSSSSVSSSSSSSVSSNSSSSAVASLSSSVSSNSSSVSSNSSSFSSASSNSSSSISSSTSSSSSITASSTSSTSSLSSSVSSSSSSSDSSPTSSSTSSISSVSSSKSSFSSSSSINSSTSSSSLSSSSFSSSSNSSNSSSLSSESSTSSVSSSSSRSPEGGIDQYTVLMIHADGDETNERYLSLTGEPLQVSANPYSLNAAGSWLFDGSDYLMTSSGISFGSNDFTVEFWVKWNGRDNIPNDILINDLQLVPKSCNPRSHIVVLNDQMLNVMSHIAMLGDSLYDDDYYDRQRIRTMRSIMSPTEARALFPNQEITPIHDIKWINSSCSYDIRYFLKGYTWKYYH